MATHREIDALLGKRFATDFIVVAVDEDPERTVTLRMYGERYRISLAELLVIIERGFVIETGGMMHA